MNVLVTGATGALGTPLVAKLVQRGDRVRALTHSPGSHDRIRAAGGEPVPGSLSDAQSLRPALTGVEAVLHLATRIPSIAKAALPGAWRENDLIRRDGTRALVDAALNAGVSTFVYPSVTFGYVDSAESWIDAATPVDAPALASTFDAEREVSWFARSGGRGVVLRLGLIYGPTASMTHDLVAAARRGLSPFPGPADGFFPLLWTEDAAAALVAALQAPSGIYDVVDDEPMRRRELDALLAHAVARPRLRRPPDQLAALAPERLAPMLRSQRVSNRRFREATQWAPQVPSLRAGLARLFSQ